LTDFDGSFPVGDVLGHPEIADDDVRVSIGIREGSSHAAVDARAGNNRDESHFAGRSHADVTLMQNVY